jgi:hypothetical protein
MQLYSFRSLSDAVFLLVALTLAVSSFLLIASTLVDHLRNYKYPTLQVRSHVSIKEHLIGPVAQDGRSVWNVMAPAAYVINHPLIRPQRCVL